MKIKAYDVELTTREWADRLGLEPQELMHYIHKGLTVEELFTLRGPKYKPPKPRKPRESKQMVATKERMAILLEMSGIADRNDTEGLEVERLGTGTNHAVHYKGELVGVYNYKTGRLRLSDGQGIPLGDMEWEDAKIVRNDDGKWSPHSDTHRILLNRAVKTDTINEDDAAAVYNLHKQAEETRKSKHQTYEGFGKRYTCKAWAHILGIPYQSMWWYLNKGYSIEEVAERRGITDAQKRI